MGRPGLVMLPQATDWRWGRDADTTPWYPTLALYRQPSPGAWAPVVERVAVDLARRAAQRAP